jgi:hypothetical protein
MQCLKLTPFALCILIGLIGAAAAQTDPAPPATSDTAAPDPVICRTQSAPTGSRIGAQKLCLKESEWKDQNSAAQRQAEQTGSWSPHSNSPVSGTAAPTATPHGASPHF